jgi:uncharacterized SAM-binding protein YcdF (DUF218 family)
MPTSAVDELISPRRFPIEPCACQRRPVELAYYGEGMERESARATPAVVALMIGELSYMPMLNRISKAIVARAVEMHRATPGSLLICESAPMTAEAVRLGVHPSEVVTALPQAAGHTTRLVALWFARSLYAGRPVRLVTHTLHARRSVRIFSKMGIPADPVPLDLPFERDDPDWKLRSAVHFKLYSAAAHVYCRCRGWL